MEGTTHPGPTAEAHSPPARLDSGQLVWRHADRDARRTWEPCDTEVQVRTALPGSHGADPTPTTQTASACP